MRGLLRQALRSLRLPLLANGEVRAAHALRRFLRDKSVLYADSLAWVHLRLAIWAEDDAPERTLRAAVQSILDASDPVIGLTLGRRYFEIHKRLKKEFSFGHAEASAFLSHVKMAEDLARNYRLSAARITRMLTDLDSRVRFSRQSVAFALGQIGLEFEINESQAEDLFASDKEYEVAFFADADLGSGARLVQRIADTLGFGGDVAGELMRLAKAPGDQDAVPYLQILHFQCTILEFFDHSVLDLYEFSPRGQVGEWLFGQYPPNINSSGNPFLNNAKAVGTMDRTWANRRGATLRPKAIALFNMLSGLDTMDYAARREVALSIRAWICLFLRLSEETVTSLPERVNAQELSGLLAWLHGGNTRTLGIVEQRFVDAMSRLEHPNWLSRGLGDSINATNVSARKLGDCDYQDSTRLLIVAYESHGGKLTPTYIEEHIRTLRKVIPLRRPELESVAPLDQWTA